MAEKYASKQTFPMSIRVPPPATFREAWKKLGMGSFQSGTAVKPAGREAHGLGPNYAMFI